MSVSTHQGQSKSQFMTILTKFLIIIIVDLISIRCLSIKTTMWFTQWDLMIYNRYPCNCLSELGIRLSVLLQNTIRDKIHFIPKVNFLHVLSFSRFNTNMKYHAENESGFLKLNFPNLFYIFHFFPPSSTHLLIIILSRHI